MRKKFAFILLLFGSTLNGLYAQMGIEPPFPLINNESEFLSRISPLDAYIQSLTMEETPEDFTFIEYPKPFLKKAIEAKKIYAIYFSSLLLEDHPNYNYSSLIDSSNFQFKYDTAGKLNLYEGNNIALIERDKGWSSNLYKIPDNTGKLARWNWMAPDMDSLDVDTGDRFNTPVELFFGPYRKFCSIKRNDLGQISSYTITEILPKFDKEGLRSARISLYNGSFTNYEINNYTYNENGNIQKIIKYRWLNDTIYSEDTLQWLVYITYRYSKKHELTQKNYAGQYHCNFIDNNCEWQIARVNYTSGKKKAIKQVNFFKLKFEKTDSLFFKQLFKSGQIFNYISKKHYNSNSPNFQLVKEWSDKFHYNRNGNLKSYSINYSDSYKMQIKRKYKGDWIIETSKTKEPMLPIKFVFYNIISTTLARQIKDDIIQKEYYYRSSDIVLLSLFSFLKKKILPNKDFTDIGIENFYFKTLSCNEQENKMVTCKPNLSFNEMKKDLGFKIIYKKDKQLFNWLFESPDNYPHYLQYTEKYNYLLKH